MNLKNILMLLFTTLFSITNCFAEELETLGSRLAKASVGDYNVTEQNKMISVLNIYEISYPRIILEEISIPSALQKKFIADLDFKKWVESGAEGHTSWNLTEIELEKKEVLECFSPFQSAWLKIQSSDHFLTAMLGRPLKILAKRERRKIGAPPMPTEVDTRKFWSPSVIFEGKKLENSSFTTYKILWPKDYSELSENEIHLYFSDAIQNSPFPVWLQVKYGSDSRLRIQSIDLGKNLKSPVKHFPRRIPAFSAPIEKTNEKIKLKIHLPKYYDKPSIYAIDTKTQAPLNITSLCQISFAEDEHLLIDVENQSLNNLLKENNSYQIMFEVHTPVTYQVRARDPIVW